MSLPTTDSILDDLTLAGQQAITSVMGTGSTADLQALLATDSSLLADLAAAAQKATAGGLDQSDLVSKLQPVQQALMGGKAQQFKQKLQLTKQQLTAMNGASGAAAGRLAKAGATFNGSLKFICNQVEKISKADTKIKKLDSQLADILDSTNEDASNAES